MSFINDDFMLSNGTAKELYHGAGAQSKKNSVTAPGANTAFKWQKKTLRFKAIPTEFFICETNSLFCKKISVYHEITQLTGK